MLMLPAAFLLFTVAAPAASEAREIRKSFPLSAQGRVTIDTHKGFIKVTSWDQAKVDVEVRIEDDSILFTDRDLVRDTQIDIDASDSSLRLKTRYPQRSGWFGGNAGSLPIVRYVVKMPRTAQLRIKDYKSDIDVDGLAGSIDIDTYKGEVRVGRQDGGQVNVKTYKSDARIEMARLTDRMSFETYRGEYAISMPRDARFDLDTSSIGRRGTLHSSFATVRRAGTAADGPKLVLKSYRGTFSLR